MPRLEHSSLLVTGYVGDDVVSVGAETPPPIRSTGGSLWHFLLAYSLAGSALRVAAITDAHSLARCRHVLPEVDWSPSVVTTAPAEFRLRYPQDSEELEHIGLSLPEVPPASTLVSSANVDAGTAVHVSSMPSDLQQQAVREACAAGCAWLSIQLHGRFLPQGPRGDALLRACRVRFCNSAEYAALARRSAAVPDGDHGVWVVTSRTKITVLGAGGPMVVDLAPIAGPTDSTGAGDAFAGAFLSVADVVDLAGSVRYAAGVAAIVVTDYSSRALERVVARRRGTNDAIRTDRGPID